MKPSTARAALCGLLIFRCGPVLADGLSGRVSSDAEGRMEGVLVSARKPGSPMTLTVVSDREGRFRFPEGRLAAGHYDLAIRAVGYELARPASIEIGAKRAEVELKLGRAKDLAAQLTNTEWLMSMPGTAEQKRPLIECMSCHTYERIARSKDGPDALVAVLKRMATYANNSTTAKPQKRAVDRKFEEDALRRLADYLASVNLSKGEPWPYPLKTLPRPSGRATRVLVTEYDLPRRTIAPHDVRTDARGMVWYSNFSENTLGRLDPATGAHSEFAYPAYKPGFPTGALCLELDGEGNWWLSGMFQTGVVKFDVKSETFRHFPLPAAMNNDAAQQSMVMPRGSRADGKVWSNEVSRQAILRLDMASGQYELFDVFKSLPGNHAPYGLVADAGNNLFFMDFGGEAIGRVDAKTGQVSLYPTPTKRSRPRRTMIDALGRIWFAEFAANKVAMFDPKEESFREWEAPTPHTYPYDVFLDRNGELWSGSMSSDRIVRMDTTTGAALEYLLPRPTNVRRVFVDNSTTPVTFWVGSNHGASIVRLQPLD